MDTVEKRPFTTPDQMESSNNSSTFFGKIAVLHHCMVVECPYDCVVTLGHYRAGDCNTWRRHWLSATPLAAAKAGVWVGRSPLFFD